MGPSQNSSLTLVFQGGYGPVHKYFWRTKRWNCPVLFKRLLLTSCVVLLAFPLNLYSRSKLWCSRLHFLEVDLYRWALLQV